jgi:hypothetical protein
VCSDSAVGVEGRDVAAEEGDASYEADGARGKCSRCGEVRRGVLRGSAILLL